MTRKLFVTGTDTGVGKTYVSTRLLAQFSSAGYSTLGIKPIASGSRMINGKLMNEDALRLNMSSSIKVHYDITNPFSFEPAIAPHTAAQLAKQTLDIATLSEKLNPALAIQSDITILEGAGGWLLPLNHHETLADYVVQNQFEIILVVGMRLGCLNHALLTEREILKSGGNLIGWIANCIDPEMALVGENIATLSNMLKSPHLETIPFA